MGARGEKISAHVLSPPHRLPSGKHNWEGGAEESALGESTR